MSVSSVFSPAVSMVNSSRRPSGNRRMPSSSRLVRPAFPLRRKPPNAMRYALPKRRNDALLETLQLGIGARRALGLARSEIGHGGLHIGHDKSPSS